MITYSARCFSTTSRVNLKDVFIVSAMRTPIGSFQGALSSLSATQLGAMALKAAIDKAGIEKGEIQEVYMGQVNTAGCKQSPARQVVMFAGLPVSTEATTINKVCASGLKSIMLAAQTLMCGHRDLMAAGGMESMSNAPFLMQRGPTPYGSVTLHDSIVHDGLTDVYDNIHMGMCAESIVVEMDISRDEQDEYGISSYRRSQAASAAGVFKSQIVPVSIVNKKKKESIVVEDEEISRVDFEKFKSLRPAFKKDGTVTAGNASTLNDGACCLILATQESVERLKLNPIARIIGFADAATRPIDFTIAPSLAVPRLLQQTGAKVEEISMWEINEAFSAVAIANIRRLKLDPSKVNVHGGAVSMGHPIGMSGARLITHMVHLLKKNERGVAAICNGGGGASSMLIEKL